MLVTDFSPIVAFLFKIYFLLISTHYPNYLIQNYVDMLYWFLFLLKVLLHGRRLLENGFHHEKEKGKKMEILKFEHLIC